MRFARLLRPIALRVLAPLTAAVLLAGCAADTPSPTALPTPAPDSAVCHDWQAVLVPTSATLSRLYVSGAYNLPTTGHEIDLRRRVPQGINPADLLLETSVTPPSGRTIQMIWTVRVSYDEETETPYETVTILPYGVTVPVVKLRKS